MIKRIKKTKHAKENEKIGSSRFLEFPSNGLGHMKFILGYLP